MTALLRKMIIGGYFFLLALGVVYVIFTVRHDKSILQPGNTDGVACTMEAKLCPDGSSVGRIPPSCEFAKCPGEVRR